MLNSNQVGGWHILGAPGEIKVWNSKLFPPVKEQRQRWFFVRRSVKTHTLLTTYSQTPSAEKQNKTGEINMYTILIYWKWVVRCVTRCKLLIFPPDLTVFGLLCRSPPVNSGQRKVENLSESLKTVPPSLSLCSGPSFHQRQRGTESQAVSIKIRWVVEQGQGVMTVIYTFSCLCSVRFCCDP